MWKQLRMTQPISPEQASTPASAQVIKTGAPALPPVHASGQPQQVNNAITLTASSPTGLADYVVANPIVAASLIAGSTAIVVGLLTLFGVVLSLVYAHKRMKAELSAAEARAFRDRDSSRNQSNADRQHATDEANKERQHAADEASKKRLMEARKGVYITFVDEFMAVLTMFGRLQAIDPVATPDFQQPLLNLGASVNKTWLLSEVDTAVQARDLYSSLNEMFLRLMKRTQPLFALNQRITQLNQRLKAAEAGGDVAAVVRMSAEIADVQAKRQPLLKDHLRYLLQDTPELMKRVHGLMLATRIELGIRGDNAVLERQTAEIYERAVRAVSDAIPLR